jgi:hypothetical protein
MKGKKPQQNNTYFNISYFTPKKQAKHTSAIDLSQLVGKRASFRLPDLSKTLMRILTPKSEHFWPQNL